MEAEKPDIQVGCQLSNEQLASRITLLEAVVQKVFLHIDKLRKEVDAIKREGFLQGYIRSYFLRIAHQNRFSDRRGLTRDQLTRNTEY